MAVVSTFEDRPPHDNGYLELTPPYFSTRTQLTCATLYIVLQTKREIIKCCSISAEQVFWLRQDQRCETVTQWSHLWGSQVPYMCPLPAQPACLPDQIGRRGLRTKRKKRPNGTRRRASQRPNWVPDTFTVPSLFQRPAAAFEEMQRESIKIINCNNLAELSLCPGQSTWCSVWKNRLGNIFCTQSPFLSDRGGRQAIPIAVALAWIWAPLNLCRKIPFLAQQPHN